MSKFKFKLNGKGVADLMKSPQMQGILTKKASAIVSRAGDGYESKTAIGQKRSYANVAAVTFKAKRDNMKNNTLLKAVKR